MATLALEQLKVGAFADPSVRFDTDVPTDLVDARIFQHAAFPGRTVVRLTPQNLGVGEDAALDFLGFSLTHVVPRIAQKKRQAVGFPAWVLMNEPAHAAEALSYTRKLRQESRKISSKPGNAKIAFDALGTELARRFPSFLPSFYEEVGRAFVDNGNTQYGAAYFGKAREAEAVFALPVDEAARREAFVEFALAGAVTNKSMSEYARDLAQRYGDAKAYEIWKDVCVRRVLGGAPLSATLFTDLKKLAKAAGKKPADAESEFALAVWDAPALARSAAKVWEVFAPSLEKIAKTEPRVAHHLLSVFPRVLSEDADFGAFWMELLRKCGSFDALEGSTEGGPARWLTAFLGAIRRSWYNSPRLPASGFELIRRLAQRLRNDGVPVEPAGEDWNESADPDVVDLLLELDVPVTMNEAGFTFRYWADIPEGSHEHGRDLVHLMGRAEFREQVVSALDSVMDEESFHAVARGKAGLVEARRAWLMKRVNGVREGTASVFETNANELIDDVPASLFVEFPEAAEALADFDDSKPLAETLRRGFLGEFSWPALAAMESKLGGRDNVRGPEGVFPYAVFHNQKKAVVLGPDGIVFEHDLKLKKSDQFEGCRYVNGQLLVSFYNDDYDLLAYWSSNPKKHFEMSNLGYQNEPVIHLPNGYAVEGPRAYTSGDESLSRNETVLWDGETFWKVKSWDEGFVEFDPFTGETGRASLPAKIEDALKPDEKLSQWHTRLYPVSQESPLGNSDGFFYRMGIDGETYATRTPLGDFPGHVEGGVKWPGGSWYGLNDGPSIEDEQGETVDTVENLGGWDLPLSFFHHFRPVDAAASEKLRKIDDATVKAMFDALDADGEASARGLLVEYLGETPLADAVLQRANAHLAAVRTLRAHLEETQARGGGEVKIPDSVVWGAFEGLGSDAQNGYSGAPTWADERDLDRFIDLVTAAVFDGVDTPGICTGPSSKLGWFLAYPKVIPWMACTPAASHEPAVFARLLRKLAESQWFSRGDSLTTFEVDREVLRPWGVNDDQKWFSAEIKGMRVVGMTARWDDEFAMVAHHSGPFVPFVTEDDALVFPCTGTATSDAWALEVADLIETRGAYPWRPELVSAVSEHAGIGIAEAALIWRAFWGIGAWQDADLDADTRKSLKLKVADVKAASQALREVPALTRLQIFSEAFPDEPRHFWDQPESVAQALGESWRRHVGKRVDVPVDLIKAIEGLGIYNVRTTLLETLEPKSFDASFKVVTKAKASFPEFSQTDTCLTGTEIEEVVLLANYLYGYVAADDPFRAAIAQRYDAMWTALSHDRAGVGVEAEFDYLEDDERDKLFAKIANVEEKSHRYYQDETVVVVPGSWGAEAMVRTAKFLADPKTPKYVSSEEDTLRWLRAFAATRSVVARMQTALPQGAYEANPAHSAPEVVASVQDALGVPADAAVAFLQTLCLPDPTTNNVRMWNEWTAAQYKKAFAPLLAAGVLIEAKRSRAGRTYFIDGPWLDTRGETPIEEWKLALYPVDLPRTRLAVRPFPDLFDAGWNRWQSGDKPGFTKRGRK